MLLLLLLSPLTRRTRLKIDHHALALLSKVLQLSARETSQHGSLRGGGGSNDVVAWARNHELTLVRRRIVQRVGVSWSSALVVVAHLFAKTYCIIGFP